MASLEEQQPQATGVSDPLEDNEITITISDKASPDTSSSDRLPPSPTSEETAADAEDCEQTNRVDDTTTPNSSHIVESKEKSDIPTAALTLGDNDEGIEKEKLRWMLRMHIWAAVKLTGNGCTLHFIYCFALVWGITKVGLITVQMIRFGGERAKFITIVDGGHTAIRHLMLKDWNADNEGLSYPPSRGLYALYHRDELKVHVEHAVENFYNYPWNTIGFYRLRNENLTRSDIEVCIKTIANSRNMNGHNLNVSIDCFAPSVKINVNNSVTYGFGEEFEGYWNTEVFESFVSMHMKFLLHSIRTDEDTALALCLEIEGVINYRNTDRNGQVKADLDTTTTQIHCDDIGYGNLPDTDPSDKISKPTAITILIFSGLSAVASFASLIFGIILCYKIRECVKKGVIFPKDYSWLSYSVRCIRLWDIVTFVGDILTFVGTLNLTISVQFDWTVAEFDLLAVHLGVGCILSWVCLLRFFRFHARFHLLFKALYGAIGNVLAYLMCVCVMFVGFALCGYVILGPYHAKFQTLSRSAECLFSLVNGDEVFYTLNAMDEKKTGSVFIWWFSRFYICVYVSIFTIVILNLLIAIFNTVYEEIQNYYRDTGRDVPPLNRAFGDFMKANPDSDASMDLRASILKFSKAESTKFTKVEDAFRQELICALKYEKERNESQDPLKAFIIRKNEDSGVKSFWKFSYLHLLPPAEGDRVIESVNQTDRSFV